MGLSFSVQCTFMVVQTIFYVNNKVFHTYVLIWLLNSFLSNFNSFDYTGKCWKYLEHDWDVFVTNIVKRLYF